MDPKMRQKLMKCKKCESPLDFIDCLDLMAPPVDEILSDEVANIIIPFADMNHPFFQVVGDVQNDYDANYSIMGMGANLTKNIEQDIRLFEYMSGHSSIDHPMCQGCANMVVEQQEKQLQQSDKELALLESYLTSLQSSESIRSEPQLSSDAQEMQQLEDEEKTLMRELETLQQDNEDLNDQISHEKSRLAKIELDYNNRVTQYNSRKQTRLQLKQDIVSLMQRRAYLELLTERLKTTNLLDIVFPICCNQDGRTPHLASISGLRLGRLPEAVPLVEWPERNAAWGQCLLLLQNALRKLGVQLPKYELHSCGSNSYIESRHDKKKYLLHQNSGIWVTHTRIDQAMVVFLECLSSVMAIIEKHDPNFRFPYTVDGYKLADAEGQTFSIKLNNNSDENWTKALKYMLIDLKWIETWFVKASFKKYCDAQQQQQQQHQ